jgi:hypothetical protein
MMKSWGMDPERLHQRALANLDRAHGEIAIKQVGKLPWLHVIETGDGYAASRALLHWRWAELTLTLGDLLILGMPTRDVVVFTSTQEPEKIEQMRETVETVERHQGRPVSRKLFQWTPQGGRTVRTAAGTTAASRESRRVVPKGNGRASAPAKAEVARQAADAQQGGQPRQKDANQDRISRAISHFNIDNEESYAMIELYTWGTPTAARSPSCWKSAVCPTGCTRSIS